MPNRDTIQAAIRSRDVRIILKEFFEGSPPKLRDGCRHECDLWDFKSHAPGHGRANEKSWAEIAADVLAFHNRDGGIIFFGVNDEDHSFCGTSTDLDSKRFNDKLRRYVGDAFWVLYSKELSQRGGHHLGIVVIPKRTFRVQPAIATAATSKPDEKPYFEAGDICVREGDETKIFRGEKALQYLQEHKIPTTDFKYAVSSPGFRILSPDYKQFVFREKECADVLTGLEDKKSFITLLMGFGGLGKTALGTWAALEMYEKKRFSYIISASAKDRELTSGGIQRIEPTLSSFDALLDTILEVMGFAEQRTLPIREKEQAVTQIIEGESVLLYVDNLETVDDPRIFSFLENLPTSVRVLATSRNAKLRRGIFPVDVGPMSDEEADQFFEYCCQRRDPAFLDKISNAERHIIFKACGYAPLIIEWLIANSKNPIDAIQQAHILGESGKFGDELIEFCFRRFDAQLSMSARRVLRVISLFLSPLQIEAIAAGAQLSLSEADDACEELISAGLIQKQYSQQLRDSVFSMLPVTQKFAYQALRGEVGVEAAIRKSLSTWYDAKDVADPLERRIIAEVRKGTKEPEALLVEYADSMRASGNYGEAEKFYTQALQRNLQSWQALRGLGEIHRHEKRVGQALSYYERAATYCPKKGPNRALIFREWGMILRDEGLPDSFKKAADKFETALKDTPNDALARHGLGHALVKTHAHSRAIAILEPLLESAQYKTQKMTVPLLKECYEKTGDMLKLAELNARFSKAPYF